MCVCERTQFVDLCRCPQHKGIWCMDQCTIWIDGSKTRSSQRYFGVLCIYTTVTINAGLTYTTAHGPYTNLPLNEHGLRLRHLKINLFGWIIAIYTYSTYNHRRCQHAKQTYTSFWWGVKCVFRQIKLYPFFAKEHSPLISDDIIIIIIIIRTIYSANWKKIKTENIGNCSAPRALQICCSRLQLLSQCVN